MTSVNGCDSIITLDLTVNATYSENLVGEICAGSTYEVGDSSYTSSGIYVTNMLSVNGCDSILILNLTVLAAITTNTIAEICEGDSILLEGIYQTIAGDYTDTLSSISGCDSIIITTLTINEKSEVTVPVSICSNESYFAGGANQTMTWIYYDTLNTVNGCDSIVITVLTVLPTNATPISVANL